MGDFKMFKKILIIFAVMIITAVSAFSQVGLAVYGGISTPNDRLNSVYSDNSDVWELYNKGIDLGWHLGARFHVPIDEGLYFFGGLGWIRCSGVQLEVMQKDSATQQYKVQATQDIIPIGVGLQYYITQTLVKFYGIGQLNYNYFTTHGSFIGLPAPNFNLSEAANRAGFTAGIGVEFNALLVSPFLEFSYSLANLIGKADKEPTKSYFLLSLGIKL